MGDATILSRAELDVLAKRRRQVAQEGWTPAHDDFHVDGELARAGAAYAVGATLSAEQRASVSGIFCLENNALLHDLWPFATRWWKPKDRRRDLVKAGALILAEIERVDRAEPEGRT